MRLLPLSIPLATVATEIYAKILIQDIVTARLDKSENAESIDSLYIRDKNAQEAARILVNYPSLKSTEGVVEHATRKDGGPSNWHRIPIGSFEFSGRREVQELRDCQSDEVGHGISESALSSVRAWYCVKWRPIESFKSTHDIRFTTIGYKVGPFSVYEIRDSIIRRSDQKEIRSVINAEITGGIMWHLGNWFGGDLASGFGRAGYIAQTSDYLDTNNVEEYLITGKH